MHSTQPLSRARPQAGELASPASEACVLGRYRLGRRLGAGGFGTVWAAWDERLEREVAVKVVPRDAQDPPRAAREGFAAARLNHPGIVALYEVGEDDVARYLVSELVRGRTLAELTAARRLSDRDVARIGTALCDALAHAHAHGVVHRDVKPHNVLVPDRPAEGAAVAKLMDFGIAQLADAEALTHTGDVVGTLAYMAPEQAEGRRVTRAADVYSLALVLYEALADEHPVRRPGAAATARRIGSVLPSLRRKRPDLGEELCAAIDRALRPRPAERGGLGDLRSALASALPALADEGRALAGSPVEGLRPPPPARWSRIGAGVAAGGLAWAALADLAPAPPGAPAALAAAVAVLVALLPRAGWLAAAIALVTVLVAPPDPRAGTALVAALGLLAVPLLLPGDGRAWSLPAAAPLLGVVGAAGAFPALAGQARAWWRRAALGAAGLWWLALAEPLTGKDLFLARPGELAPRGAWEASASAAAREVLGPLLESGVLALALLWALFAVLLPWLVRGRTASWDIVGASAWAAGLAAATGATAHALAAPEPRGAVAGAVLAGVAAVGARVVAGDAGGGRVA